MTKRKGIFIRFGELFFKENPEQFKDFQERQILTIQSFCFIHPTLLS
jgi:hypothetical protein